MLVQSCQTRSQKGPMPLPPPTEPDATVFASLAAALDRVDVAILLLDRDLRIRYVNACCIDLLHLTSDILARGPDYGDLVRHVCQAIWKDLSLEDQAAYVRDREAGVRSGTVAPTLIDLPDGRHIRFRCDPCADGGRIITYWDVTDALRQGGDEVAAQLQADLRFTSETLESQAAHLAALAEAAEEHAQRAETARLLLESEIEERRQLEAKLRLMATTDGLTGALNRAAFMAAGEQAIERARGTGQKLALLMLDADHFKRINDRFGHAGGDLALRHLVQACKSVVRQHDLIGRLGGEEFAVALPGASAAQARDIAERLRRQVEDATPIHFGQPIRVTVSIGVAEVGPRDATMEQILARADDALYRAKAAGRNQVAIDVAA